MSGAASKGLARPGVPINTRRDGIRRRQSPQGAKTMPTVSREEAASLFGRHWQLNHVDDLWRACETLGPVDPDDEAAEPTAPFGFSDLGAALEAARAKNLAKREKLAAAVADFERRWSGCEGRWVRFRISWGLVADKAQAEANIARLAELRRRDAELVRRIDGASLDDLHQRLPERIRVPVLLEAGQPVWRLMTSGRGVIPAFERSAIAERVVCGWTASRDYDVGVSYRAFGSSYCHDSEERLAELRSGFTNVRVFVDEAAAKQAAREMIAEVRAQTDALEASLG